MDFDGSCRVTRRWSAVRNASSARAQRRHGAAALLTGVWLLACQRPDEIALMDAASHRHSNGLVVSAGPQWRASVLADGLRFEPAAGNTGRREALVVTVRVSDVPPQTLTLPKRERIGQRELAYGVERAAGGGSGGDEYVLTAVEPWGQRYLLWHQAKQSESGEPEFELWALARGLGEPKPGGMKASH